MFYVVVFGSIAYILAVVFLGSLAPQLVQPWMTVVALVFCVIHLFMGVVCLVGELR
jgi:hypothetical protein